MTLPPHGSKAVEPLRDLLGDVLTRLEALEAKAGLASTPSAAAAALPAPIVASTTAGTQAARQIEYIYIYIRVCLCVRNVAKGGWRTVQCSLELSRE